MVPKASKLKKEKLWFPLCLDLKEKLSQTPEEQKYEQTKHAKKWT